MTKEEWTYLTAFSAGYTLAMQHGVKPLTDAAYDAAVEEALHRLDPLVYQRLEEAKLASLRPVAELLTKRREVEQKGSAARTPEEQAKYRHYGEALAWALHANGVPAHQS